ncbi:MAG: 4Fe-4S binding protein [Candidatus Brocadia sp.]
MAYYITEKCVGCGVCSKQCPTSAIYGKIKERFLVNTAKCIGCGVCGMACPSAAIIDPKGETCIRVGLKERPKPVLDTELCSGCGYCVSICPFDCLKMQGDNLLSANSWYPVLIKPGKCVSCGQCAAICAKEALDMQKVAKAEMAVC